MTSDASQTRKHRAGLMDLLLVLVAIVWGSSYITTKTVVTAAPVLWFLTARFGIAAIGFNVYGWRHVRRATRQTLITGLGLGVFLAGIFVTETFGVKHTTAIDAGFLISLNVVMVPWVEVLLLRYRIRWPLIGAMAVAVLGTVLVTSVHGGPFTLNLGDGLILISAALRATQMTVTKRWVPVDRMDIIALNGIQFTTVFLICGVASVLTTSSGHDITVLHAPVFWVIAVYLGVLGTVVAFVVQMVSIQHTSAARAALLLGLEPAFAAVFAVVGGEALSVVAGIGGALIVAGTLWGRRAEEGRRAAMDRDVLAPTSS
uniref:DMT superfamily permease n=2 Tax=Sulfobacillus thermotolerans TaxID=338644 RepID=G5CJ91_9FIRM|nr:DMT superfamily permease [Sulfobacillus thermotolerans]